MTWGDEQYRLAVVLRCLPPIDEIAAELKRRVGRDLTEDERRRFGLEHINVQQ